MRERSVKNDETDYYRTRETPSTSPGTLGAIFGCPIGPGSGPGRTRRNERVTRRTPHGLGLMHHCAARGAGQLLWLNICEVSERDMVAHAYRKRRGHSTSYRRLRERSCEAVPARARGAKRDLLRGRHALKTYVCVRKSSSNAMGRLACCLLYTSPSPRD